MANYIGHRDPESILSLSQAYFAGNCYPQAVYRLRQVLKYMPRLAMVRLQPKAFYGDPSVYVENVQQLDDYLATAPGDVDALLLRAYYAWFDTDDPRSAAIATEALTQALSADSTPDDIQAIDAFWSGMVATGRVTGQLKARPAVKAAPTAAAPQRVPKAQRATSASH
jgi:hypothetical protein